VQAAYLRISDKDSDFLETLHISKELSSKSYFEVLEKVRKPFILVTPNEA